MIFFFSLEGLGAILLMILIICGLSFDQMTPFFEFLVKWYPVVVIIAILGLIISTVYFIYRDKSVSKGIMSAFCLTHTMFFGLSVPYEILWALTLEPIRSENFLAQLVLV